MKANVRDNDRERENQEEYTQSVQSAADDFSHNDEDTVYGLLAGYRDENGTVHNTFTLREMNGTDEEAIHRGDVKTNGAKMSTVLLTRCVTSIGSITKKGMNPKEWENIIKSLLVGDRDVILMELRRQSIGETIEVTHTCPHPNCKARLKTSIDLDELEVVPFDGLWEIPFELPKGYRDKKGVLHRKGTMRRANGLDGEVLTPLAKNNLAKAETTMLTRLCKFDDGVHVDDTVMASLSVKDRNYLQSVMNEHLFGINMTVPVMCDRCGEEFQGSLNQTNFM